MQFSQNLTETLFSGEQCKQKVSKLIITDDKKKTQLKTKLTQIEAPLVSAGFLCTISFKKKPCKPKVMTVDHLNQMYHAYVALNGVHRFFRCTNRVMLNPFTHAISQLQ